MGRMYQRRSLNTIQYAITVILSLVVVVLVILLAYILWQKQFKLTRTTPASVSRTRSKVGSKEIPRAEPRAGPTFEADADADADLDRNIDMDIEIDTDNEMEEVALERKNADSLCITNSERQNRMRSNDSHEYDAVDVGGLGNNLSHVQTPMLAKRQDFKLPPRTPVSKHSHSTNTPNAFQPTVQPQLRHDMQQDMEQQIHRQQQSINATFVNNTRKESSSNTLVSAQSGASLPDVQFQPFNNSQQGSPSFSKFNDTVQTLTGNVDFPVSA